jgi:hypothetical protein
VHSLLSKRAFHVDVGNFEGMNFSDGEAPQLTIANGTALARELLLSNYSLDATGLQKLHRLKEIMDFHPTIVNPALSPQD